MPQPTQRTCKGCGAVVRGRGGKDYCGPECRPRCCIEACEKPVHSSGLCSAHSRRASRHGDPLTPLLRQPNVGACSIDECTEPSRKRGWCVSHYSRWRRLGSAEGEVKKWNKSGPCRVCAAPPAPGMRQFCSLACAQYWYRHEGVLPSNPRCARCSTEIELTEKTPAGHRKRSDSKLCRRCKIHHRTEATPGELALRDGPLCQLCGLEVDLKAVHPDPMRPSVDHIVPRARGGSDEASNNQLTHLRCNQIKSDRIEGVSFRSLP